MEGNHLRGDGFLPAGGQTAVLPAVHIRVDSGDGIGRLSDEEQVFPGITLFQLPLIGRSGIAHGLDGKDSGISSGHGSTVLGLLGEGQLGPCRTGPQGKDTQQQDHGQQEGNAFHGTFTPFLWGWLSFYS